MKRRALTFAFCLSLFVFFSTACVPTADANTKVWFFSAEAWGGSPFGEGQKKRVFLDALSAKSVRRLVEPVPFEVQPQTVEVVRFEALYEVDAAQTPPLVKNGYRVVLELGDTRPERVTFSNVETGVTRSLQLDETGN